MEDIPPLPGDFHAQPQLKRPLQLQSRNSEGRDTSEKSFWCKLAPGRFGGVGLDTLLLEIMAMFFILQKDIDLR